MKCGAGFLGRIRDDVHSCRYTYSGMVIAATAVRLHAMLVTRDARIQAAGIKTVW